MTAKIQVRRDTTTNWNAGTPPTLDVGEIGLDTDLKQIKIGDNTNNWTALPWLGGTLPYFSSPSGDIDDATNRVAGVYRWPDIASISAGTVPAAPIDIKAVDGGINMLVLKFGTTVMQHLWTDGDGTVTPKSYSRVYDGDVPAWRAWVPQNLWGIDATEGVDAAVKSLTAKDTVTVETTLSVTGSVSGVMKFADGSVTDPSITNVGDEDTGMYFPGANEISLATAGVEALAIGSSQGVTCKANLQVNGAVFGNAAPLSVGGLGIQMNSNPIFGLPAGTVATNPLRFDDLIALSSLSFVFAQSNGVHSGSDGTIDWTYSGSGTASQTLTASAGNWTGIGIGFNSNGQVYGFSIRTSPGTTFTFTNANIVWVTVWAVRKRP